MPTIALRLEPERLENPDLDLRYELPDAIERETDGAVRPNGYDYGRTSDALVLFLETRELASAIPAVIAFLERETLLENVLAGRVIVAVSERDCADRDEDFAAVYPRGATFTLA